MNGVHPVHKTPSFRLKNSQFLEQGIFAAHVFSRLKKKLVDFFNNWKGEAGLFGFK